MKTLAAMLIGALLGVGSLVAFVETQTVRPAAVREPLVEYGNR
jgi:hypothetical protein